MGSRLTLLGVLMVSCWLPAGCGCGAKPAEPAAPVFKAGDTTPTGEKPTTKEPKLEINPNYQGR